LKFGKSFCYYLFIIAGSLAVLFLLTLRFALPAWIDRHPQELADLLARQLDLSVTIAKTETEWNGWNPRLTLHDFRMRAADANHNGAELYLPEVAMLLDWRSLFHQRVLLRTLRIEAPELTIRRDANGDIFIGGFPAGNGGHADASDVSPFARWLRQQNTIEINRGTLFWHDEMRGAPPLVIHNLNLRGKRVRDDYQFGMRGVSNETALEVRARIARPKKNAPSLEWYLRFEHLNFPHLTQWFDLPIAIERGIGNAQTWGRITEGRLAQFTVDAALDDALARLAPDSGELPPFELQQAQGRFTSVIEPTHYTLGVENLSFTGKNGIEFPPTAAQLTLDIDSGNGEPHEELRWSKVIAQATHAHLTFDHLQLKPLANLLLSIPATQDAPRALLEALHPQGMAKNGSFSWNVDHENPQLHGEVALEAFSVRPYQLYPGADNVNAQIHFTQNDGSVDIDCRNAVVHLPHIFPDSVPLTQLDGTLHWSFNDTRNLEVNIDHLYFANEDAKGKLSGAWFADGGAGIVDLTADIEHAEAARAYRYIPMIVDDDVRQWLHDSLLAGQAHNGHMVLRGALDDFPFYDTDEATALFQIEADVQDVNMRYDPEWPMIEHINGKLIFRNESMTIQADQGTILNAPTQPITTIIPDLGADFPHLLVDGSVQTGLNTYLQFLEKSPVGGWINHVLRDAQGNGNALLNLHLDIPLSDDDKTESRVNGELTFDRNRMMLPQLPELEDIKGKLSFTESGIHGEALSLTVLGNPGSVSLHNTKQGVLINALGTLNLARLKEKHPFPYDEYFHGEAPWTLTLETNIDTHNIDWILETPLTGVRIDLPAPLNKAADVATPLHISRRLSESSNREEIWQLEYQPAHIAETVRLIAQRVQNQKGWQLKTLAARIDRKKSKPILPDTEGAHIDLVLPTLDLDAWYDLLKDDQDELSANMMIRHVNITANTLTILDKTLHDFRLKATPGHPENPLCANGDLHCWMLDVDSAELTGKISWEDSVASMTSNGRIHADLDKLVFTSNGDKANNNSSHAPTTIERGSTNPWPVIDIDVAHLYYQGNDIGHVTLEARPHETDWRIERFLLSNDAGQVDANGWWRTNLAAQKTELWLAAHIQDVQKFLARLGIPEGLVASDGMIEGQLSWSDSPTDFDLETLDGNLTVNIARGRFTKIEPGIGRLLGVFSLQALPRRITLDFRDVFSEGFAFDRITGTAAITNGIMHTDDTLLDGPAAKVNIMGNIDLVNETQKIDVRVRPSLTEGVSLGAAGAATLLMSTPVSAAAVGIGALVGQMILDDPVGKMFSYEYLIEGSWDDPVVEKKNILDNRGADLTP